MDRWYQMVERANWRRLGPIVGVLGSLVAVGALELVRARFGVGLPGVLLVPVALFATLAGGLWTGIVSAFIILSYATYYYGMAGDWLLNLTLLSIATVASVAMVAWWRRRLLSRFDRHELPETTVQAAARRYRELVEDLDLIFWEGQLDEGFSFVSPQVVDLLGYPLEQWLDPRSKIMEKVVHPDDRARLERLCEKARESGEGYEIDFRLIAQDGTILWVHNLTRVIPTPDGGYLMHGVVVDVTDRRKAEEALRTSERRYRIAQNLSLDAFAILEPVFSDQGKIVDMRWEHANAAAARLWDRQPEQLRGQLWTNALAQTPQNQLLFSQYARVAENGISSDTEVSFHSKTVRGWVRSIAVRVDGSVAVSLSDISEKRMVEQALRESEQRFRTLADSAPVLIWLAGPDKLCTYVNRAWLELTGRTFEQELGTGWLESLHPDDLPATMETVEEAKSQRRPFRCEFRIRRHDGEYRWLISQGAPRFSPDGTFTGYVGSCVDITERKHAEQQLERRLDQQETVVELGQTALASKPLMPLMQHAVEEVAKTLDVDYCKVLRYDEQAHHFVLTAAVGFPQEAIGSFTVDADVWNQAGYTLQSASPVIVDDLRSESRFSGPQVLFDQGIISGLSVIIPGENDRPYGIFGVHTRQLREFTTDDVNFVQAVAHVLATAIQRAHAEQALRFSEIRFRSMFDQAAVGIAHADPTGKFTAVNHRLCEMLGYTPGELRGRNFRDITYPGDLEADEHQAQRLIGGEIDHYTIEKRFVRTDGSLLWAELTCSAVRDSRGGMFAVGIISDISSRKQAQEELNLLNETLEERVTQRTAEADDRAAQLSRSEHALREQKQVLQSILDSIGEGIVVADNEGRFVVWNPAARRLVGEPEDMSPAQWIDHYHLTKPDGTAYTPEELPLARAIQGDSIDDADVLVEIPGEPIRWLSVSTRPLLDPAGNVRGGVAILHDATERRVAEKKLRDYQLQLRALASELTLTEQRERRRLAQTLHDHLQQILVAAQLRIGLVRTRSDAPPLLDSLEQVSELINEAIDASRSLTLELSPPILYDAGLVPATHWLSRQMEAKHDLHVEVETNFEEEHLPEDVRILLFQAVRELLFNVVKHAGSLWARVKLEMQPQGALNVIVEDRGRGVNLEQVPEGGGTETGFGLFSIRERLEIIGGAMHIESVEGEGTRITLTTPPAANRPAPARSPDDPEPEGKRRASAGKRHSDDGTHDQTTIRVLLADDHKVLRDGLASLLGEQPDIEIVAEAVDGQEAVELTQQVQPDVVVMDITMPRMNGVEATRQIMRQMPHVRVIGLSMHDKESMAEEMREAGAVAYLPKGGPADMLVQAIRDAVPAPPATPRSR